MKHKKHMDADVKAKVKPVDSDEDGKVSSKEKDRANEIGDALNKVFKKHMKKDEEKDEDEDHEEHEEHEEGDEDEKGSKGLTKAQMKLPPKLRAAILNSKGKKHMDADDEDEDEDEDDKDSDGLENPDKADLDKDGK